MWRLTIAIFAPVQEPIPGISGQDNMGYAGTERVVACLVKGLYDLGHDVHLFAAGNSSEEIKQFCTFHAIEECSLRQKPPYDKDVPAREGRAPFAAMTALFLATELKGVKIDIIINHLGFQALAPYMMNPTIPMVTVLHGYLGAAVEREAYLHPRLLGHPVISISRDQLRHLPGLSAVGTVYNPIPDIFDFRGAENTEIVWPEKIGLRAGSYLAWVGRFSPEKRPHIAMKVAIRTGIPLVMAGKREAHEEKYWNEKIQPLLDKYPELLKFIGEVNDSEKNMLMGGALAFLMPINWHEPFGLVVPEAMYCGTPVIATRMGSMEELIVHGKTGYLVTPHASEDHLISEFSVRVRSVHKIDRAFCRFEARRRFGTGAAARGYTDICRAVLLKREQEKREREEKREQKKYTGNFR